MAITITRADVKRKCMIATSDTTYDSAIDSLISEMQPALEYGIAPEYVADTGNTGLQATLKLGILENKVLQPEQIDRLAKLPPREQLLAELAGAMSAPVAMLAMVLEAKLQEMAGLIDALREKRQGEGG